MDSEFIAYDNPEIRASMKTAFAEFRASADKLASAGIDVKLVSVSDVSDFPEGSEIREEYGSGKRILPASSYMGVIVDTCGYPSDKILVDYLDVPPGLLSADRTIVPAGNDLMQSCSCSRRR